MRERERVREITLIEDNKKERKWESSTKFWESENGKRKKMSKNGRVLNNNKKSEHEQIVTHWKERKRDGEERVEYKLNVWKKNIVHHIQTDI